MWRQIARDLWLKEGNHSTKLYYHNASQRRKKNNITRVNDWDGNWKTKEN